MAKTKEFPIEVVAGLISGINLGSVGDIHECAEFIAGHSIWMHEFAERALFDRLRNLAVAQLPFLQHICLDRLDPEAVPSVVASLQREHGLTVTLTEGDGKRTEHPLESLERIAPGKEVIVVTLPVDES